MKHRWSISLLILASIFASEFHIGANAQGTGAVDGICQQGYACVPWQNCVEDESLGRPANYDELSCGDEGQMCCEATDSLLSSLFNGLDDLNDLGIDTTISELPTTCGHSSYDCVPYFQCVDGEINTDGSGLIDVRVRPTSSCNNPEYPDVPAVCCLIPGSEPTPTPVEDCPVHQECVDFSLCSVDGKIVTDGTGLIDIRTGYTSCYLPSGLGGRCCTAPDPIVDQCPGDSVCVDPTQCIGTALDSQSNFIDYIQEGSWSRCLDYDQGVCCSNPGRTVTEPTGQFPASECGIRNENIGGRILSHNEASFGEFPWQSIIFYQNYTFNCGASMISNQYLLTAAHCVYGLEAKDIRIRLGEWQVNSFDEALEYIDIDVVSLHIHEKYNPKNLRNDIAILQLVEPVEYQFHINSICLPTPDLIIDPHTPCIATGWGKDSFTGNFQHIMKKVKLPFVDRDECQALLRKTRLGRWFRLAESFVCAGGEENEDACFGDGGGPFVCKLSNSPNYFIAGITSWGIGCGQKDVPGVYANVQNFVVWIHSITGL